MKEEIVMKINKPKISICTDKSLIDAYNEEEFINYKFTENIDESITINNITIEGSIHTTGIVNNTIP